VRKTNRAYQVYQAGFDQEVPGMQHILDFIRDEVVAVADISQALLVHGDFNAANVLITDNVVSAVADFNDLMVAGDPLMDFTSSIIGFLEAEDGLLPEDGQFLLEQIVAQSRPDSKRAIHLYRLYYALVFGSSCKDNDPRTYAWSIKTLREHAAGSYRY
jgi:aminoglycoside phosphotransferase (APT) family kinase protein